MPDRLPEDLEERPRAADAPRSGDLLARAVRRAEQGLPGGLDEARLLGIYDRLRQRILRRVETRGGRMSTATVQALLLVPDVFMLLVRLALDPEVPGASRALIGGALIYFVLPVDILPEAMLGPAGYLEDLVLASAVLAQAFGGELETYAQKYWSGRQELRLVLRDITNAAHTLLGENVHRRLEAMLARRGVRLPQPSRRREALPARAVGTEPAGALSPSARRGGFATEDPAERLPPDVPLPENERPHRTERRAHVRAPVERTGPVDPDLEDLSPDELLRHGEEHA